MGWINHTGPTAILETTVSGECAQIGMRRFVETRAANRKNYRLGRGCGFWGGLTVLVIAGKDKIG